MYQGIQLTREEEKLFEKLDELTASGYEICQMMRAMVGEKNKKLPVTNQPAVVELVPNSGEIYALTESYKERYVAASIIIEKASSKKRNLMEKIFDIIRSFF
ncbi:hypothetical protein [Maridesulfovibrio bastinii]|uniref:hypothetical protein n=1 Tax=Maridesulfovibrio bastinii TaxID=47157 RepID=UPI000481DA52|nr:hypothetical protein [Maridesulfovibrio bastinii]